MACIRPTSHTTCIFAVSTMRQRKTMKTQSARTYLLWLFFFLSVSAFPGIVAALGAMMRSTILLKAFSRRFRPLTAESTTWRIHSHKLCQRRNDTRNCAHKSPWLKKAWNSTHYWRKTRMALMLIKKLAKSLNRDYLLTPIWIKQKHYLDWSIRF